MAAPALHRLKMQGRRVRPRLHVHPSQGRLARLLELGLQVAYEAAEVNSVDSLTAWATRELGAWVVRAALRAVIASAGPGALRRALREQLALLNAR